MKERFKILKEFIRFILVSLPVFVIVFTAMHVGFFFYDCYKLIKKLYEKVIFEHPDSIFYTEAQKQFRTLRGDNNL